MGSIVISTASKWLLDSVIVALLVAAANCVSKSRIDCRSIADTYHEQIV